MMDRLLITVFVERMGVLRLLYVCWSAAATSVYLLLCVVLLLILSCTDAVYLSYSTVRTTSKSWISLFLHCTLVPVLCNLQATS
jgi:hypothetical protein